MPLTGFLKSKDSRRRLTMDLSSPLEDVFIEDMVVRVGGERSQLGMGLGLVQHTVCDPSRAPAAQLGLPATTVSAYLLLSLVIDVGVRVGWGIHGHAACSGWVIISCMRVGRRLPARACLFQCLTKPSMRLCFPPARCRLFSQRVPTPSKRSSRTTWSRASILSEFGVSYGTLFGSSP